MGVASPLNRLYARLNLASHLLLAAWLCLLLAQPHLLAQLPGKVLAGGVLLLVLVVACPPYQSKITAKETDDAQS
jgi:NADH:ubiquinone oxidoreductase subunit 6 (subunit J)